MKTLSLTVQHFVKVLSRILQVVCQQAYYAPINHFIGFHPVIHVPIITWITTHLPTPEGWMAE